MLYFVILLCTTRIFYKRHQERIQILADKVKEARRESQIRRSIKKKKSLGLSVKKDEKFKLPLALPIKDPKSPINKKLNSKEEQDEKNQDNNSSTSIRKLFLSNNSTEPLNLSSSSPTKIIVKQKPIVSGDGEVLAHFQVKKTLAILDTTQRIQEEEVELKEEAVKRKQSVKIRQESIDNNENNKVILDNNTASLITTNDLKAIENIIPVKKQLNENERAQSSDSIHKKHRHSAHNLGKDDLIAADHQTPRKRRYSHSEISDVRHRYSVIATTIELKQIETNEWKILRLLLPTLAGTFGSLSGLMGKTLVELFGAYSIDIMFSRISTYIFISCMAISLIMQIRVLNAAFSVADILFCIPVYQVMWSMMNITLGMVYFQDYKEMDNTQLSVFPIAVFIIFIGIYLLSQRKSSSQNVTDEQSVQLHQTPSNKPQSIELQEIKSSS